MRDAVGFLRGSRREYVLGANRAAVTSEFEEMPMTLQIGLVSRDGDIVLASDRCVRRVEGGGEWHASQVSEFLQFGVNAIVFAGDHYAEKIGKEMIRAFESKGD